MKIAVSSTAKDLDSPIDPRFGRCAYFLIVNTDEMSFEIFSNESAALSGGAGIQAAQFIVSKGAEAVITGNCGPKAAQTLSAAGVELYLGNTGSIRENIEKFKRGELISTNQGNVPDHSGLAATSGVGRGRGMGGGRGVGGGRGMGRGKGMSRGR